MFGLEGALLNEMGDTVDGGILLVFVGMEAGLHVHSEEFSEGLPEAGSETAEKRLHDVEGTLVCLPVDEFEQNFPLILRHVLHYGFILLEDVFLKTLQMLLTHLLVRDGLDIFVSLA